MIMENRDLTFRDEHVLGLVFDPESAVDARLDILDDTRDGIDESEQECRMRELAAIRQAQTGDYVTSVRQLSGIISEHPERASSYNNRAQVYRLMSRPEDAMEDLNTAIDLCTPVAPSSPIMKSQAKVLAQAHTQRATLFLCSPDKSKDEREAAAQRDLFLGGRYGNALAREAAVGMNKFAKMCGDIVRVAREDEMAGGQY